MQYYEDFTAGDAESFGEYQVTEEEVIQFAERYDPQPFHTDPDAARDSMYGGLIASGWQTTAITMRLLTDNLTSDAAFVGGAGVDDLRWLNPVYPGDTLSLEYEILGKEPQYEDFGVIRNRLRLTNQNDEVVVHMTAMMLFAYEDSSAYS